MMLLSVKFVYPLMLALVALALPVIWFRSKRQAAVLHSRVSLQGNLRSLPVLGWLPNIFFFAMTAALAAALANPVLPEVNEKRVLQTRDIILAVDISSSMNAAIPGGAPPGATVKPPNSGNQPGAYRRLDAAADAVKTFVATREGDRVGLFAFDDDTYFYWPMTENIRVILRKADLINKHMGGGTNFEGPSSDSDPRFGPIQSAIEHWKEYGQAKTKVLIMVSDGEAPISDKRFQELTSQMEALGGRIYMLGIGESWTNQQSFSSSQTEPIRRLVERLNGKCFAAADAKQMQEAMEAINSLEKSRVEVEHTTTYRPIYHYFVAASIIFLVLFLGSVLITRERA